MKGTLWTVLALVALSTPAIAGESYFVVENSFEPGRASRDLVEHRFGRMSSSLSASVQEVGGRILFQTRSTRTIRLRGRSVVQLVVQILFVHEQPGEGPLFRHEVDPESPAPLVFARRGPNRSLAYTLRQLHQGIRAARTARHHDDVPELWNAWTRFPPGEAIHVYAKLSGLVTVAGDPCGMPAARVMIVQACLESLQDQPVVRIGGSEPQPRSESAGLVGALD